MSKVQADNQIRFQDLENTFSSDGDTKKITKKPKEDDDKILPGSSQPQDLGSVSYKDTATVKAQQTQSVDTTATIVTEVFQAEEKILPKKHQRNNTNLLQVF